MKTLYPIVGMRYRGCETFVNNLTAGVELRLVREPGNKFDPAAVQVWAAGQHVGYIPKNLNKDLAAAMDLAQLPVHGRLVHDPKGPQVQLEE